MNEVPLSAVASVSLELSAPGGVLASCIVHHKSPGSVDVTRIGRDATRAGHGPQDGMIAKA